MCLPACAAQLAAALPRRAFLRRIGALAGAAVLPASLGAAEPLHTSARRVVDLTHTLGPDFPIYAPDFFATEQVRRLGPNKFNALRWRLYEHIGTHLDAPLHFSAGESGDRIPADKLVGPLAIVDLRARAAADPDAQLTPDDLRAWNARTAASPKARSSRSTAGGMRSSAMRDASSAAARTGISVCRVIISKPSNFSMKSAT